LTEHCGVLFHTVMLRVLVVEDLPSTKSVGLDLGIGLIQDPVLALNAVASSASTIALCFSHTVTLYSYFVVICEMGVTVVMMDYYQERVFDL